MARKFLTLEQMINRLREAEVALSQGATVAQASREVLMVSGASVFVCPKLVPLAVATA